MTDLSKMPQRVQARYDELMLAGKHGHYETLFQIVREEVSLSERAHCGREEVTHPQIIAALEAYHYYEDPNDPNGLRQDFEYDRMEATLKAALASPPPAGDEKK